MASTEAFGFGFSVELLQKDIDRLQGAENGRRITIAFFLLDRLRLDVDVELGGGLVVLSARNYALPHARDASVLVYRTLTFRRSGNSGRNHGLSPRRSFSSCVFLPHASTVRSTSETESLPPACHYDVRESLFTPLAHAPLTSLPSTLESPPLPSSTSYETTI